MIRLLVALTVVAAPALAGECDPAHLTVEGDFGQARFSVDVADDAAERAQGLMQVESMPTMQGMIFVYDAPQPVAFWMENTLIPLDMIFAGEDGTIRAIHPEAVPLDRTPIPGGEDIQFVLEINGGLAARLGVEPGDRLVHPAIQPCE